MYLPAKNYSILGLELIGHRERINSSLKKDLDTFLDEIRQILVSTQPVQSALQKFLGRIFEFRLKAIREIYKNSEFDLIGGLDEAEAYVGKIRSEKQLAVLVDNVLFAMRWNRRVARSLLESANDAKIAVDRCQLPDMDYNQFVGAIAISIPERTAQKILDWTNASMIVEFGALSLVLIDNKNLRVSEKTLSDLEKITAEAAQQYAALAIELGVFRTPRTTGTYVLPEFDETHIDYQQMLADQGLEDYADNLQNDETQL